MIKIYQWVKGEKRGGIVKSTGESFVEDNIEYMVFNDGSMINTSLITEYLIEIPSEDEGILLSDLSPQPMKRVERQNFDNSLQQKRQHVEPQHSPLEKLLIDSKKIKKDFTITVSVNLPSPELIKVLSDSYEKGEEQIIDFLSSSIDLENIKEKVALEIKQSFFKKDKPKVKRNARTQSTI